MNPLSVPILGSAHDPEQPGRRQDQIPAPSIEGPKGKSPSKFLRGVSFPGGSVAVAQTTSKSYFNMPGGGATWTVADQRRLMSIDALHTRVLEYHNNVHVRSLDELLEQQSMLLSTKPAPFSRPGGGGGGGNMGLGDGRSIQSASVLSTGQGMEPSERLSFEAPSTKIRGVVMSTRLAAAILSGSDMVAQVMLIQPQNTSSTTASSESSVSAAGLPRQSQFTGSSPLHYAMPTPLSRERLGTSLSSIQTVMEQQQQKQAQDESMLLWIHVSDATIFEELGRRFGLHELAVSGFLDLRAHSSLLPTPAGLFVSFCSFVMIGTDVFMNKTFILLAKNLVITHEREVHPDTVGKEFVLPRETVFPKIHERLDSTTVKLMLRYGPAYVLYMFGQTALTMQDSIIDFFSRTLYYFKHVVHTRLHHREKLKIHRKMHIIAVSIGMLQKQIELNIETLNTLVRAASGGGGMSTAFRSSNPTSPFAAVDNGSLGALAQGVVGERQLPYVLDLCDGYKFANHCLMSEFEETLALDKAMDSITSLRSINTNTLLSLVATIFLPLNFLTGVFGTNFQTHNGSYTMTLLQDRNGPYYFAAICLGSILVIVSYFVYNGWVELRINSRRLCWCLLTKVGLASKASKPRSGRLTKGSLASNSNDAYMSDSDEDEEVLAEETRRTQESLQRRSSAMSSTNRDSLGQGGTGSFKGTGAGTGVGSGKK